MLDEVTVYFLEPALASVLVFLSSRNENGWLQILDKVRRPTVIAAARAFVPYSCPTELRGQIYSTVSVGVLITWRQTYLYAIVGTRQLPMEQDHDALKALINLEICAGRFV